MKGVSMTRVTSKPHAYCLGNGSPCTFERRGISNTVRTEAQRHAFRNPGHEVFVDVVDRTTYTREEAP